MKYMNNKKSFSLVEMLVALVVSSIIVLTIGAISSISLSSHKKTRQEAAIFADITYSLKFIKRQVRKADLLFREVSPPADWVAPQLIINSTSAIGLYNVPGDSSRTELIYLEDKDANVENNKIVLFYVDQNENIDPVDNSINFTFPDPDTTITIDITGVKNGIPFDITDLTIKRRLG